MIVLEEPYVSEPLVAWLEESGHPVLDNAPARDLAAQGRALNLVPEDEAARRLGAGERVYANSENALAWIVDHVDNPGLVHAIQLFKDKARMREELKPLDPDLFFRTCSVDELFKLDFDKLETPFVLKPSVGFCSMGVHAVHDRDDWQRALSDIAQNASAWHDLYPESVVGTGSFMLEGYLEGTEYALDAYFDETGAAHVLDVLRHDFAGPADTSDRLYVTSPALVRENAALFESWLDRVNARVGARNFPVHVEVRVRDGHVSPIEFNPLRFAGLGGTDVSWLGYGFRTYAAFLDDEVPAWDDAFRGKEGKVYSMSLLTPPAGAPAGARFDYDAFEGRFSHVLGMWRFDVDRVGSYGFLFLETDQDTADELEFVKTCDLTEFLPAVKFNVRNLLIGLVIVIVLAVVLLRGDQLVELVETMKKGAAIPLVAALCTQLGKYFSQELRVLLRVRSRRRAHGRALDLAARVRHVLHEHHRPLAQPGGHDAGGGRCAPARHRSRQGDERGLAHADHGGLGLCHHHARRVRHPGVHRGALAAVVPAGPFGDRARVGHGGRARARPQAACARPADPAPRRASGQPHPRALQEGASRPVGGAHRMLVLGRGRPHRAQSQGHGQDVRLLHRGLVVRARVLLPGGRRVRRLPS